jgi:hypothetical protein
MFGTFAVGYALQILPVVLSNRKPVGSLSGSGTNFPTGLVGCDAIQSSTLKIPANSSTFPPSIIVPFLVLLPPDNATKHAFNIREPIAEDISTNVA